MDLSYLIFKKSHGTYSVSYNKYSIHVFVDKGKPRLEMYIV